MRLAEVFFNHYKVLKAHSRDDEAQYYLVKAYDILRQKSDSIKEGRRRRDMLNRVPLSKAILSAMEGSPTTGAIP